MKRSNLFPVLIGAVIRKGRSLIPNGATTLQPGDHAVIVAGAGQILNVDEILEGGA